MIRIFALSLIVLCLAYGTANAQLFRGRLRGCANGSCAVPQAVAVQVPQKAPMAQSCQSTTVRVRIIQRIRQHGGLFHGRLLGRCRR